MGCTVRKHITILCVVCLLLLCCGCQYRDFQNTLTVPQAFFATADITHGAFTCKAKLTFKENGTTSLELLSPETLKTLTVTQTTDSCVFSFLGLEVKTPEALLPDTAFAKLLYAALCGARDGTRCVKTVNGDIATYSGMTEAGDTYSLTQSREDGSLLSLTMDGQNFKATFSEFQIP